MRNRLGPPSSVLQMVIEAKARTDQAKLRAVLLTLTAEDPSFGVSFDQTSGRVILKGTDERHLEIKLELLRRSHGFELHFGAPEVAYLETMTRTVEQDYTYDVQLGFDVQFARVRIAFEPIKADGGRVFVSEITGDTLPRDYVSGVEKGIERAMRAGVLAGFPVVDVRATLIAGAVRDGTSSALAFEIAAQTASRQALQKGGPQLLEPVMHVEVVTPHDFIGAVVGDLQSRRGRIQGEENSENGTVVTSIVPLANMFGYRNQLRSFSRGRARFTMNFACYEPVPPPSYGGGRPTDAAAALRA